MRKGHGHGIISIRMLNYVVNLKSLEIIYNKCLERGWFPVEWKKTVVPVHKKSGKQLIQNYQPISLLPI